MKKILLEKFARRAMLAAAAFGLGITPLAAMAQQPAPLKIGVLSDMSGIVVDLSGPGSVVAAKMAIEDAGGKVLGRPIELLQGDHLNKPDTGLTMARQWYDNDVRAIFDIGITTVALGMQDLAREKNRIVVYGSSASSDLTGKNCSPNGIHWTYNSYAQAYGAIKGALAAGGKTWYFITVDYTYGKNVQRDATAIIEKGGGKVIGSTTHPFSSTEFSSQLLQAQASKADVIALATTTAHAAAMIKQADEFGVRARGQKLAPLSLVLNDVKALGLKPTQDLFVTEAFYWDQNDQTRKFANKYKERFGKMPNMIQAGTYSSVSHYLKAVAAAGTDDTAAVLAKMKSTPVNDFMTKNGSIREDGRMMRDFYIFRIKKPSESKGEWDLYSQTSIVPALEVFPPVDKSVCSLVK
ncbi:ABC transporter substrate-binding protein [Ottowia thiooxydans]|uniref:ABC transporter substrate-binding protein n=1 Tax=Ottowia thiooxydans TaxID=219182 RepID=UPI0003F4D0F5|nr:ABC transporter substrate-binding protein [Ottowia thiooxydans]